MKKFYHHTIAWCGLLSLGFVFFFQISLRAQAQPDVDKAPQSHPWSKYVQQFRSGHNIAQTIGSAQGVWQVDHFGQIQNGRIAEQAFYGKVQYSFHLQVWGNCGYLLGSSFGYLMTNERDKGQTGDYFYAPGSVHLPGLLIGLTCNFSPVRRLTLANDSYLERLQGVKDLSTTKPTVLDATMLSLYDAMLIYDHFFEVNLGLRVEAHWRKVLYRPPNNAEKKQFVEGAHFEKSDQWLGLGLVYHFL